MGANYQLVKARWKAALDKAIGAVKSGSLDTVIPKREIPAGYLSAPKREQGNYTSTSLQSLANINEILNKIPSWKMKKIILSNRAKKFLTKKKIRTAMNKLAFLPLMAAMSHPGALSELPIDLGKYERQRPYDPKQSKTLKERALDKANKRRSRALRK